MGPGKLRPRVNRPYAAIVIAAIVCTTAILLAAMFLKLVTRADMLTFASYVATGLACNSAPSVVSWFRSKKLDDGDSDPPPSPLKEKDNGST